MPQVVTRIHLFGGLWVQQGERTIRQWESRKAAALLGYLALRPDREYPREQLAELLWPDGDPEATRGRLRQTLAALRRALEPVDAPVAGTVVVANRVSVRLASVGVSTDVGEFEAYLREAARAKAESRDADRRKALEAAVTLYTGSLLPELYEPWTSLERERFSEAHIVAARELAALLLASGDASAAVEYARKAVQADTLREDSHVDLMLCYEAAGRITDAVRQYLELERILRTEWDTAPAPETRALYERLRIAGNSATAAPPQPLRAYLLSRRHRPPLIRWRYPQNELAFPFRRH